MDSCLDNISDEEVFFGEMSLKEVKKRIFLNSCSDRSSLPDFKGKTTDDQINESIHIIETKSEPNVSTKTFLNTTKSRSSIDSVNKSDWEIKSTDDSFLKLEKMVSDMCLSPKSNNELDNTLEMVDYILNNQATNDHLKNIKDYESPVAGGSLTQEYTSALSNVNKNVEINMTEASNNLKEIQNSDKSEDYYKDCKTANYICTPAAKKNDNIFKTPKNVPSSSKKPNLASTAKKTPSSVNTYKHITSPVAFYIKKCPQVPLIRDIHLKKPLSNNTSIPKMIKSTLENKASNKENIVLPSVAYKSAKKTQMISVPDTEKLPSSQWAKKLNNSLPKPIVIKHGQREMKHNSKMSTSKSEESFVNLPLKQADVSVCTKKSAYSKNA